MNIRILTTLEKVRSSYWFVPALMVVAAIVLSFVAVSVDHAVFEDWSARMGWFGSGDPDGARTFLSTIAGSMITIAGVTFSITMVALSQASMQLGPRLLTNFMRDRGNQIVLGTFIATFVYCLLVMRSVKSTADDTVVPQFALLIGMALSLTSVGVLVYFFHHGSVQLQAEYIIEVVGRQLEIAVGDLFPEQLVHPRYGRLKQETDLPEQLDLDDAWKVPSSRRGYVQVIDIDRLVQLADEHDWIMRLVYRPGDFVAQDSDIVAVWPAAAQDDALAEQIEDAFVLGKHRLRIQDVEFPVHQLVEIALRALSPGINDPFTALACVDQLASGLSLLVERSIPAGYHYGEDGQLRVLTDALTFTGVIEAAFNQIRQHARGSVAVTIRLLEAIATIAPHTRTREQRDTLSRQAEMILRGAEEAIPEQWDREAVQARYDAAIDALSAQPDAEPEQAA